MKKEKIIVDTNIIVDVFTKREPHFTSSKKLLKMCEDGTLIGHISASTATDIYYIVNKYAGHQTAEDALGHVLSFLTVIDVTSADVLEAYSRHSTDFEDCLLGVCALKSGINRIVTRDKTGFNNCGIPFLSAEQITKEYDDIDGNGHIQ